MTNQDDERLAELRRNVGRAIQEFAAYQQELFWERPGIVVLNWAVSFEMANQDMAQREQAISGVCVPDAQDMHTSVGAFWMGAQHWTK